MDLTGLHTLMTKQDFDMIILITRNRVTACVSHWLARQASFFNRHRTNASVLYLLYLFIRWFIVFPYINGLRAFHAFVITVLAAFLFAGEGGYGKDEDGNGNVFHRAKIINACMICKSSHK